MTMGHYQAIAERISAVTGSPFRVHQQQSAGGGCINQAVVLADGPQRYFVKLNTAARVDMFAAEAEGLEALRASGTIRAPEPICWGTDGAGSAFLVLEYIEFRRGDALDALGEQLAALHRTSAPQFGWQRDNTIGSTPQINSPADDWARFFEQWRLGYQLELAAANGYGGRLQARGEQLREHIDEFFPGYSPQPALLHGDLWGGNWAADSAGAPVIYDPAVYFGDREADLAMTELFGGFGTRFYRAYENSWPLDPGYATRKTLYNLYHVLNHLNLFGGGYRSQAEGMIERLLAECR